MRFMSLQKWGQRWPAVAFIFLLVVGLGWQVRGAWDDGPTTDEPIHLAAGLVYIQFGQFAFTAEDPPLPKLLAAASVRIVNSIPLDPTTYPVASLNAFLYQHPMDIGQAQRIFFVARLPTILFWLGSMVILWFWGNRLWHRGGGLVAAGLAMTDPTLLGHGHLVTSDMAVTFGYLATMYALVCWIDRPDWRRASLVALGLTVAILSKFSAWLLIPIIGAIVILAFIQRRVTLRAALGLVVIGIGCLLLGIWFSYGGSRIAPVSFVKFESLTAPEQGVFQTLWYGMKKVAAHNVRGHLSYFFGKISSTGWKLYFPTAVAIKLQLVVLGLMGVSTYRLFTRRLRLPIFAWLTITLPPVVLFISAMAGNLTFGWRHILPVVPFIFLWCASVVTIRSPRRRILRGTVLGLTAIIVATLTAGFAWPNTISYFNAMAGGTNHGHQILLGSDLDWGQDSWRLVKWLQTHPTEQYAMRVSTGIPLSFFRGAILLRSGILPSDRPTGTIIVSKKILYEQDEPAKWLRPLTPIDQIGSTILVYRR